MRFFKIKLKEKYLERQFKDDRPKTYYCKSEKELFDSIRYWFNFEYVMQYDDGQDELNELLNEHRLPKMFIKQGYNKECVIEGDINDWETVEKLHKLSSSFDDRGWSYELSIA